MASNRIGRINEEIQRELAELIRNLKDPRVQGVFLSIVRVEVTNDFSYCKVYISAMEGLERAKEAVRGLDSAAGYMRTELGHRLSLRHVPKLLFTATDSIEYSAEISRKLLELKSEVPAAAGGTDEGDGSHS